MSIVGSWNLISKLSFNLNPRLVHLSRLKRNGVRCFAADSSGLGFPVRYIPKKCKDAYKTQGSNSGDDSNEDIDMPTRPESHIRDPNTLRKRSNIGNQKGSTGFSRDPEQEFRHMRLRPLEETAEELQTNNESVQGHLSHSNGEISYRNEVLDSESMKVPKESFPGLHVYKQGGQGKQRELQTNNENVQAHLSHSNREISYRNEGLDYECIKAPEESFRELHASQGKQRELHTNNEIVQGHLSHSNRDISYRNKGLDSDCMKVPKESFRELHAYKKGVPGKQHELQPNNEIVQDHSSHSDRDISYCNKGLDSECMKVPRESFRELHVCKKGGQEKQWELNREVIFQDGSIDSEFMEAYEEVDVEEGQISEGVSQGGTQSSKALRTRQDAEKLAVRSLATRAFTAVELRKKLISKQFPVNIVQSVIHDFLDRGLINDSLYAETFSQSRWASLSWGPKRIKQALVSKGVCEGDVKKAVKRVFEDGEDINQNTNIKLSNSTVEKLYLEASKQWQRSQNAPTEKRKARVIRWLQYRGFDWDVIGIILKKLESNHPS